MRATAAWPLAAWLVLLLACGAIISRTPISTDLSAFLPRNPSPAQEILVEQLRDGVVSRLVLVGIEGGTPPALAQTSKRLAARLREQPAIAAVNNGEDIGLERDRDFLWRNRYLLSPTVTPAQFTTAPLRAALEENLQLLGSPAGILLQRILPHDPTSELLRLVESLDAQAKPGMREGVWFSPDGTRALLVVQTKAAGYDIDAQESVLASIRSAFSSAADATANPPPQLLLTGPGVFSVNSRASIKSDAWLFSTIATVLVAALMLALYRSTRVLVLGLLPVASGAVAGVAAVSLGFGEVHGITLGFGATLIGEGVDYAIFLFTQVGPDAPPRKTLDRLWPTLRLGVLTSLCGFSAMLFSGFPGLAQLGLFSVAGLLAAVGVTRYVLPALLREGFTVRAAGVLAPLAAACARRAPALRYPLLIGVAAAALSVLAQRGALWSHELSSLSPVPLGEQALDKQLRRDIGAPDVRFLLVVNGRDEQSALETAETVAVTLDRLSQQGALAGFDSPALHLPSHALQRLRQSALPEPQVLRANLGQALAGLPFRANTFEPFLKDVAAAREQPLLDRASLEGTRLAVKVDSLLVRRRDGVAAMLPLRGVTDAPAIARELARLPESRAVLLDLKRESDDLYQTYRREVIHYSLLGAAAIAALLFASLRSWRRVLGILAPLAAAVVVTSSALLLGGSSLTIFHLVGLLLVVAIGSNYALFFDRRADSGEDWERILVSLLFANASTVIGFGVLAFSRVPLLHQIGATVALGALLSLAFSAILIARTGES